MSKMLKSLVIAAAGTAVLAGPAVALDKVRLVNSTKVVFEMEHPYSGVGKRHFQEVRDRSVRDSRFRRCCVFAGRHHR